MSELNGKTKHDNPTFSINESIVLGQQEFVRGGDCKVNMEEKVFITSSGIDNTDPEKIEDYVNIFNIYRRVPQLKFLVKYLKNEKRKEYFKNIIVVLCVSLYILYFVTALLTPSIYDVADYWCDGDGFLIINTVFFGSLLFYFQVIKPNAKLFFTDNFKTKISEANIFKSNRLVTIGFYVMVTVGFVIFLLIDAANDYSRLISAFGGLVLIAIAILFSKYPSKIKFEQIFWGIALQMIFALVILRWSFGKHLFECLGDKVSRFLSFTDVGTAFTIGDFLKEINSYVFKILPVVLYFGMFVSILYHFGIIQWVIIKLGWILEVFLKTTPCESMATVANIFLGMSESPLVIKPYIKFLTKSEIHTIMTGGFATVAGGILAAYISFGVEPAHLLSASIMSAPAALTMSKLFYPEIEISQTKNEDIKIVRENGKSVIHSVMDDMKENISLIAIISATLIVFTSLASFINAFLDWSCQTIGYDEGVCEVQKILGYLLYPVAWLMGVPEEDCYFIGYLLGMKIFVTEFLAYMELMKRFKQGLLSARSVVIATYALCGFSSIGSVGCAVGALGCLAPSRIKDVASIVTRAFIAGNFACFLTACVAGTLIDDPSSRLTAFNFNGTQTL